MGLLRHIADNRQPGSLAAGYRRRRFELFRARLRRLARPLHILDVGGTEQFWRFAGLEGEPGLTITLLNLEAGPVERPGFRSVAGDARDLSTYPDASVDIVFSNSTIEHLGTLEDQRRMADEIRRVAVRYFIQTPNRYFPLEPHFLFPFFALLPRQLRAWIATWWKPGWYSRPGQPEAARKEVEAIRLLTRRELRAMFPEATVHVERCGGLAKSFILYHGW
jgi:hypothetical protein